MAQNAPMVLWWIANVVGLVVVIPLVVVLANRVIRTALEARRYADEILVHGDGISRNLEPLPALVTTRDVSAKVKASAVAYVAALDRLI